MGASQSRRDGVTLRAGSAESSEVGSPSQTLRKSGIPSRKVSAGIAKFVLESFAAIGTVKTLSDNTPLVKAGEAPSHIWAIRQGLVELVIRGEGDAEGELKDIVLAERGEGDVIGELSLLLDHKSTVTVVAKGSVEVIEVEQARLIEMLSSQERNAGQLFKVLATLLSDRISELSGRMRSNVVENQAPTKASQLPARDVASARAVFGLPSTQALRGVYHCSVRREINAAREQTAHFGELYVFDSSLCFDLKVFAFHKQFIIDFSDIVAFLNPDGVEAGANVIEVQSKGQSAELHIEENFDEACLLMEACRVHATAAALVKQQSEADKPRKMSEQIKVSDFKQIVEPIVGHDAKSPHRLLDLELKEEDWVQFLSVAEQATFKKGEYVVQEGQAASTLYQIVRGRLRVELEIVGQAKAVVVGYRAAGAMLGETSLLKEGRATASLVADEDTAVIFLDGKALQKLFGECPGLPSRFFCFLAVYQAERLDKLTLAFADEHADVVASGPVGERPTVQQVMDNPAYCGIFSKFLNSPQAYERRSSSRSFSFDERSQLPQSEILHAFDLYVKTNACRSIPDAALLKSTSQGLIATYITERSSAKRLSFFSAPLVEQLMADAAALEAGTLDTSKTRRMFAAAQEEICACLEKQVFEGFLHSSHYRYILELKAKEGRVPSLDDFMVVHVLGEGGFGQVINVIKRDCGSHYAMKVMKKEMMKQYLGSSWRKKIALEQEIMTLLNHPFLVNLKYAFQNSEFLILVMDLVASGDLSEFVLSKTKRLTAEQTRWAVMEVVEVMAYVHSQNILYRDLKPENLLVDDEGHVRLIDMGLAAHITDKTPTRTSRVGTDCYMAPEVRFARRRRAPYGKSADWYTVGVLLYEFANGALPYSARDSETPTYRPGHFASKHQQSLCESLLTQDYRNRIGTMSVDEIKAHPYFEGVDWDIVSACTIPSPMKGVKGVPKHKKEKEVQAHRTAADIAEADKADKEEENASHHKDYNVGTWDFVQPLVVTEEYMRSMYACVSAI